MENTARYEKIYNFTVGNFVLSILITIIVITLLIFMAMFNQRLNLCTATDCFGINLLSLVPDYSQTIAGIAENLRQEQQAEAQALSRQLFDMYQELLRVKATLNEFKVLLPN